MKDLETVYFEHERLIYYIANKYSFYHDKEDLFQAGFIGLKRAYDKYNPELNIEFSTYASIWIKGEILAYIRKDKTIKVSNDLIKTATLIEKTKEKLTQKLMRIPTISEISIFLDIEEEQINTALNAKEFVKSLDYETNNDDDKSLTMYDSVKTEEKMYEPEMLDLYNELNKLPKEQLEIIRMRYFEDKTQQEVADKIGTNQVQAYREEKKILMKLRDKLTA